MKIKKLLFFIGFALCAISAQAQELAFKGHIYDSQTRQALAGVNIKTPLNEQIGKTDEQGYFEIKVNSSASAVKAMLVGYKTQVFTLNSGQQTLNVQLEADVNRLNEVRVQGYDGHKTNKETAGSVALITAATLARGSGVSLQAALNGIPGVRMEQSTLSEARISIRGNGVRASYGIRNIKVYLNEIPLTEADGTTRIEALDINSVGRAEVIKGPASSIYGAGTGGVINFQLQRAPYQEQSVEVAALAGSYGLRRLASTYRNGGDKMNSYVSYGWQEYTGYRQHSKDMRRFMTGNFQLFPSEKRIITLLLNRTQQDSQIPGALTQAQADANPLQANATNVDKAAARYQTWTRMGMGQQYRFNEHLTNSSSVFTYFYDLNHPLAYAYLRSTYQSYGGRTRFNYDPEFEVLPTRFTVGAEYNQGLTKGTQYVNNQGREGALNSNVDYENTQYSLFYQSETQLATHTSLTLGLSYNSLSYDVKNYLQQQQSGVKKFKPQANPRVAISQHFSDALSLHASVSTGFSPPSSSEVKNVDGSINPSLQAEKGVNYEINAKGNLLQSRLAYDLALFKMDMEGELIAQSVQQGITIYNNAGKTNHNGVELALSYQWLQPEDERQIKVFRPYASVTYSDFTFKEYAVLNAVNEVTARYDGNPLTGIAPWVFNAGLDLETKLGIYFYGSYLFSDKLPVNDANTAFNAAYHLLNAKLGYQTKLAKQVEVNVYMGIDNLLNKNYSSIVALNAVGYNGAQPAYYLPAPTRNGYGGLNLKWIF
ncbi:iron complex outermembrane receptor protein [Pedobacter sp. CAN_A7]|uniref:TonB-dependent receptor domain-containing protein n=1 Tax=Pedobacter sp. CAN_A7 TaxID=2787722 RepID=UPI0018CAACFD